MQCFVQQWNAHAIANNIAPVNYDELPFIHPWGRFVYDHDISTRYIDAENFCAAIGFTIEEHLERITAEAIKKKFFVYYLEDIDMDELPSNQVELLLTLFDEKHIMKIPPHISKTKDGRVARSPLNSPTKGFKSLGLQY